MLGVDIAGIIYIQDGWKRIVKNLATFAGNNKVAMSVIKERKLLYAPIMICLEYINRLNLLLNYKMRLGVPIFLRNRQCL